MKRNLLFIITIAVIAVFLYIPKVNAATPLSSKFKIVCQEPCQFDPLIKSPNTPYKFDAAYKKAFKQHLIIAYLRLKQLTKVDLPKGTFPITVHLTLDKTCNTEYPYAAFIIPGSKPGIICIATDYKFKLRKYFNGIEGQLAHELAHFYFPVGEGVSTIEHPLIYSLEAFIASPQVFTPNLLKEYGSYVRDPNAKKSFCYDYFNMSNTEEDSNERHFRKIYDLCTQYGFDVKHVPAFFKELRAWTNANPSKLITKQDYVEIFKKILGKDVSSLL